MVSREIVTPKTVRVLDLGCGDGRCVALPHDVSSTEGIAALVADLREREERPSIQPLKADLHQRFDVRSIRPLGVRRVDEAVWPLHGVEDIPLDIGRRGRAEPDDPLASDTEVALGLHDPVGPVGVQLLLRVGVGEGTVEPLGSSAKHTVEAYGTGGHGGL